MDICNKVKNSLFLILRLKRMLYSENKLQKSNTSDEISNISPKKVMTWNIQSLFFYTTPKKVNNIIKQIILFSEDVDLICLQEVFEDDVKIQIIESVRQYYPYYLLGETQKNYIVGEDSGILILSKYNMNLKKEVKLDCVFPCSMANKSIIYFSIGNYNFATTHLQCEHFDISEDQIMKIVYESPFNDYIILGDLNHYEADDILGIKRNHYKSTYEDIILDYILPIQCNDIDIDVNVNNIDIRNMTDHQPVEGVLIQKSQQPESNR